MPKINTFDATPQVAGAVATPRASAREFGSLGAGGAAAGAAITKFGADLKIKQERDSADQADLLYVEGRAKWLEDTQTMQDAAGEGAPTLVEDYKNNFEEWSDKTLEESELTERGKTRLRKNLAQLGNAGLSDMITFQAKSEGKMKRRNTEKALDSVKNDVYKNFGTYEAGQKIGLEIIDNSLLGADDAAAFAVEFKNDYAHKAIMGVITTNPTKALELLKEPRFSKILDDKAFAQLHSTALSRQAHLASKARVARNKAVTKAKRLLEGVASVYESGRIPTDEKKREMMAAVKASGDSDTADRMSDLMVFGEIVTDLGAMSVPQQRGFVASLPKQGEKATTNQVKIIKAARAIMSGSVADLNATGKDVVNNATSILDAKKPLPEPLVVALWLAHRTTDNLALRTDTAAVLKRSGSVLPTNVADAREFLAVFAAQPVTDGASAKVLEVNRKAVESMANTLRTKGALSQMVNMNVPVEPVDMTNPDSVARRFDVSEDAKHRAGTSKNQFFLPEELDKWTADYEAMGPRAQVSALQGIVELGGPQRGGNFLKEISDNGHHVKAWIGGMAKEAARVGDNKLLITAQKIAAGRQKLREDKGSSLLPFKAKHDPLIAQVLGSAINEAPAGTRKAIFDSVTALTVGGSATLPLDKSKIQNLVYEVMGTTLDEVNNSKTVMPRGIENASAFKGELTLMEPEEVQVLFGYNAIDAGGRPITGASLSNSGVFEYIAPGKYWVKRESSGSYIKQPNGERAVADFYADADGVDN